MKWTEKDLKEVIDLIKEGKSYYEISEISGRSYNSIRVKLAKANEGFLKYNPVVKKMCINCKKEIKNYGLRFCSNSCSAQYNNKLRCKIKIKKCLNCENVLTNKKNSFCDNKCQQIYDKKIKYSKIETGEITNNHQIKKYLIEKYGNKCMECGWCEINPTSGKVPIELEHIDGNSNNNSLDNLKLLCPNHHSLTPTYKGLNRGNGRRSRMIRYHKGKSF